MSLLPNGRERSCVLLLSGGLDSVVCLALALKSGYRVHPLFIDYGQRNRDRELAAAYEALQKFPSEPLKIVDVSSVGSLVASALTTSGDLADYQSTVVPARNMLFATLATMHASAVGASDIVLGIQGGGGDTLDDGSPAMSDTTYDFKYDMEQMVRAYTHSTKFNVRLRTPLISKTKRAIMVMARRLDVQVDRTWSCFDSGKEPCGKCSSCVLRNEATGTLGAQRSN